MNLIPEKSSVIAFSRHVISYVAGAITVAAAFHVITPDQAHSLTDAIGQIVSGIQTAAGGIATVVSIGSGVYAAWSATKTSQMKAVAANPEVKAIVTTTIAAADAIPSEKVQPATKVDVVDKGSQE